MNLLIKNGQIVSNRGLIKQDIIIKNALINCLSTSLSSDNYDKVIDAENLLIMPGGLDPHVHLHLKTPLGFSSDDFYSGSKAAIAGGTTTIIDFVTPKRGQSIIEALNIRLQDAEKSLIDYKFHISPVEWTSNTELEIAQCINEFNIKSFKIYMAYKDSIGLEDDAIFKVMKAVGKYGGIVTVHAELGNEIKLLRNKFAKQGKTAPKYHALSRPPKLETLAVKRAIELTRKAKCPLYIVHVSTKGAVESINKAQKGGQEMYAETCPQYLLFDDSLYEGTFNEVAPYIFSPPLRKKEDKEALWEAINEGVIQTVGTDHCPFFMSDKIKGKHDFRKIPNGAGGIEHRLEILYSLGVKKERISLKKFIEITSLNACQIFDIKNKGIIDKGAIADLVLWNPSREKIISVESHQMNTDVNIYEGIKTEGGAEYVIRNGSIVFSANEGYIFDNYVGCFL